VFYSELLSSNLDAIRRLLLAPTFDDRLSLIQLGQLSDFTKGVEDFDKDCVTLGDEREYS
jgi:hypothetical protein